MVHFNTYLSVAVPQTLTTADRERIAGQILTVVRLSNSKVKPQYTHWLDVGSSSGAVSSYLANNVKKITCIDIDKNALTIGRKSFVDKKNLDFVYFNGIDIPFPDNTFDVIILRRVLECAQHPEKLLKEISRVLKTTGLVYFESQNILWPDPNWDFFAFIPPGIKKIFARLFQKKHYYFATYRTFWQLKRLFGQFRIHMMTPLILKNPSRFNFTRLTKLEPLSNHLPLSFFRMLEPFNRHFIWVLKKPGASAFYIS